MYRSVLRRVFSNPKYKILATIVSTVVFYLITFLPNIKTAWPVLSSAEADFSTKLYFLFGLLGTNLTPLSILALLVTSILFGVNLALLTFYIRRSQVVKGRKRLHLVSLGGLTSIILGVGCVACGSVILTALAATLGAGWLISLLPLHGLEFLGLGMITLLVSSIYLIKKINDPLVCGVKL